MTSSSYKIVANLCRVGKLSPYTNGTLPFSNLALRSTQYCLYLNHNNTLRATSNDYSTFQRTSFSHLNPVVVKPFPSQQPCNLVERWQLYSTKPSGEGDNVQKTKEDEKQLSLFQRFKQMYKEYWYVLIPVHLITSAVWFGSFYYAAKSGIDIVPLMEKMGFSEKIINPLRNSSAGYVAIAYAMYKIATPARYAVTVGGTTVSIKYLRDWGYIKPIPSSDALRAMYAEKRKLMTAKRDAWRMELRKKRAELKKKSLELTAKRKARRY